MNAFKTEIISYIVQRVFFSQSACYFKLRWWTSRVFK